jgi:threonine aldolase
MSPISGALDPKTAGARRFSTYRNSWEPGVVRLVTSFATEQADVDDLLAAVRAVTGTMTIQQ